MFIEPRLQQNVQAPEGRNVGFARGTLRSSGAKELFLARRGYKHLTALRLEHHYL